MGPVAPVENPSRGHSGTSIRSAVPAVVERVPVNEPRHHFPDDVLRGFAVGTSPEATRLAVACHLAFCPTCRSGAQEHEEVLGQLGRLVAAESGQVSPRGAAGETSAAGPASGRDRMLEDLQGLPPPASRPEPRSAVELPSELPDLLPPVLIEHLRSLSHPRWKRLIPGIRAIDLGLDGVWRARLVAFRPGVQIPTHDHGGPEHTVVFQGGLNDARVHLERGDAATMSPGETHDQQAAAGLPCVALIVNEREPRPLTVSGKILKALTRS
jgi:putative transcriptional regulator